MEGNPTKCLYLANPWASQAPQYKQSAGSTYDLGLGGTLGGLHSTDLPLGALGIIIIKNINNNIIKRILIILSAPCLMLYDTGLKMKEGCRAPKLSMSSVYVTSVALLPSYFLWLSSPALQT